MDIAHPNSSSEENRFVSGIGFGYWQVQPVCLTTLKHTKKNPQMQKISFFESALSNESQTRCLFGSALEICNNPDNHRVFFENFFSSFKLLVDLDAKEFRVTGAMRNNRIENCPLAEVSDMKKRERGLYDFRRTSNLKIVCWNDKSVVTIGSNAYEVEPVENAKRWIRG